MKPELLACAVVLAACGGGGGQASDSPADGAGLDAPAHDPDATADAPDAPGPIRYGEVCGNGLDDDGDDLVDEDCAPNLFSGVYAPAVSADPAIPALESASLRTVSVLQTYHAMSALGISRIGPDLAAIFASGRVAHLNVEPDGYTAAQLAAPASDPLAHDLTAMAAAVATALAAHPEGRVLLTFGAEMNGSWTSWGCLPASQFIALYRAAHDRVITALGAQAIDTRRVRWVFGPDARGTSTCATGSQYYPGHAYVDLLGLSAYRSGTESVATTVTAPMAMLLAGAHLETAWQTNRFVVLQTGSRTPDRAAWLASLYPTLAADPRVAGVIYFDASAEWAVPATDTASYPAWVQALHELPVADAKLDGVFAPWFWDVPYGTGGFGEMQALYDHGITAGCGTAPLRFCPTAQVDRRTAAVMLAAAFALPPGSSTPLFTDVTTADPAFAAIQSLAAAGATTGCGNGAFCPTAPVSELELAAMITALGSPTSATATTPATRARAAILIAHGAQLAPAPI